MDFYSVKKTKTKKVNMMLWFDENDRDRLENLEPHDITVQTKIRQIIKAFLDGDTATGKPDGDLDGL